MNAFTKKLGFREAIRSLLLVASPFWVLYAALILSDEAAAIRARGWTIRPGMMAFAIILLAVTPIAGWVASWLPRARRSNIWCAGTVIVACALEYLLALLVFATSVKR